MEPTSTYVAGAWLLIGMGEPRAYIRGLNVTVQEDQSRAQAGEIAVLLDPLSSGAGRRIRRALRVSSSIDSEELRSNWSVAPGHLIPASRNVNMYAADNNQPLPFSIPWRRRKG
jgi:hypothetical protein